MEVHKAIGMVIGSRAARACDVCGHERARWYCAADEAYLCEHCDGSVHSANAVSKRHDRVRLGPNGAPMKIERSSTGVVKRESSSCNPHRGSRKRPRTSRQHPSRFIASRFAVSSLRNSQLADVKVKAEPSTSEAEGEVPDNHLFESIFDSKGLADDGLLHEVPIYMSMDQELPVFDCAEPPEEKAANESSTYVSFAQPREARNPDDEAIDLLVPESCIDIDCYLDEEDDLCEPDVDMDGIGMFNFCDGRIGMDSANYGLPKDCADYRTDGEYDEEVCQNGESPRSWLCKVKLENPPPELGATELVDADTILGQMLEAGRMDGRPKLGLLLNFEEVLSAWSDRGSLWLDGQRPQMVPDDSSLDYLGGLDAGVSDLSYNSSCTALSGDHVGLVPVIRDATSCAKSEAREARVMRYREKRRTRLFSKKIRYEVRKLNAEKRPRMKGRFVKRTSSSISS